MSDRPSTELADALARNAKLQAENAKKDARIAKLEAGLDKLATDQTTYAEHYGRVHSFQQFFDAQDIARDALEDALEADNE